MPTRTGVNHLPCRGGVWVALDHVTGDTGLEGLRQRGRMGWRLGFACYPPSFRELMAVADAGLKMPPKSTCFDPKARSGIFVRRC